MDYMPAVTAILEVVFSQAVNLTGIYVNGVLQNPTTLNDITYSIYSLNPPLSENIDIMNPYNITIIASKPGSKVKGTYTRKFLVDITPPGINIAQINGTLTNSSPFLISGTIINEDANSIRVILVDSNEATGVFPNYDGNVWLTEGANTVYVEAYDKAGNYNQNEIVIVYDSIEPYVDITPPLNSLINYSSITLDAFVDKLSTIYVFINGVRRDLLTQIGVQGFFTITPNLVPGLNQIYLEAKDQAGNIGTSGTVDIIYDNTLPQITPLYPADGVINVDRDTDISDNVCRWHRCYC
jgi:hypothetical protein